MAIPAVRKPGVRRVFILGESAAYGDPKPDYGFPRFLEVLLRQESSVAHFEVINAAMTAINSHVIVPIARDCARLSAPGDVWVLYIGNNEVTGPFGPGTVFGIRAPSAPIIHANIWLKTTRLGQWIDATVQRWRERSGQVQRWGGMEMFVENRIRQDDPQMARVYSRFEKNLEEILQAGTHAGVQIVLCTVAVNLKDCAPFASVHGREWTPTQQAEWSQLFSRAAELEKSGDTKGAADLYRQAAQRDNGYAELLFRLARCDGENAHYTEAAKLFAQARDADVLRFRADSRINQIIHDVAGRNRTRDVLLLDAEAVLTAASPFGVPGQEMFYEHVHLTLEGNYRLARAVAGLVVPSTGRSGDDWPSLQNCAEQLGVSDSSRLATLELLQGRLAAAPFTYQYNHRGQFQQLEEEISRLKTALTPASLAQTVALHRRMLTQVPDDWVLRCNLSSLLYQSGDVAGAAQELEHVLDLVPHHAAAWCDLARCRRRLGQIASSGDAYERALRLWPDFAEAFCGLGMIHLAGGELSKAANCLEAALRLKPGLAEAHLGLGQVMDRLNKPDEAVAHFQKAIDLDPTDETAKSLLGEILTRGGQPSDAVAQYTDLLRRNPTDATAHLNLAKALSTVNRSKEALSHYADAVRLQPNLVEARVGLGLELGRMGKDAEAMTQFSEAVRLQPDNAEAQFNLGVSLAQRQQFAEAVQHFEIALRLRPNDETIKEYLSRARARLDKGRARSR